MFIASDGDMNRSSTVYISSSQPTYSPIYFYGSMEELKKYLPQIYEKMIRNENSTNIKVFKLPSPCVENRLPLHHEEPPQELCI